MKPHLKMIIWVAIVVFFLIALSGSSGTFNQGA